MRILSFKALLSTAFMTLLLSGQALALPADVQTFVNQLNTKMETYLKQTFQRREVGFEVTPKQAGNTLQLTVPSYIDREMVFDVTLTANPPYELKGKVLTQEQVKLLTALTQTYLKPTGKISLESHPYSDVGKDYGIVRKAFSDLYVQPRAEAGENLATQLRMGTPVKILAYDKTQKFARVLMEDDGYVAWIQRRDLLESDLKGYSDWKSNRRVLLLKTLSKPTVYFGSQLRLVKQNGKQVVVGLPDGQSINLPATDVRIVDHKSEDINTLLAVAKQFLPKGPQASGPYLWGGTVGNRLDCSGFVQTVFRSGEKYLPRDADQQKRFSMPVAESLSNIDELKPGDLVFFSGNKKYATHVGLYIGNHQFIHSSSKGAYSGVKINRLQGGGDYDRYLQGIYFGGGRVTRSLL